MSADAPTAGIAVVVVTHRSGATIAACLARLLAARDVAAVVQRHALADARLRFVANPDNPGFAVACNQGAQDLQARGGWPWLALVNPDCLVALDTLARLRDAAVRLGGEALVGADLVDEA